MTGTESLGAVGMLERARRLAIDADTHADAEALLSAASDLVEWGVFPLAEKILVRLEQLDRFHKEIGSLRATMKYLAQRGPEFEDQFLSAALETVRRHDVSAQDLATATDSLLKWGALDDVDIAVARMERIPALKGRAAAMRAAARQLRRSGILSAFSPIGDPSTASLNRPYEAVLARNERSDGRLVVAFTGADRKFWLSLHVLYHFLSKFDVHVLYLHDHSSGMFLNGLASVAPSYDAMLQLVRDSVADLSVRQLYLMGFSAGGFVGLRAAADLQAEGFLGFGIRTDLSPQSELPKSAYVDWSSKNCRDPKLLLNLAPYLAAKGWPRHIRLITAEGARHDVAHAENLRNLPNVELMYLRQYSHHNVMPGLIARGMLNDVLGGFLGATADNGPD